MPARADLATSLQLRASAAGFLINLAGGLSLAVYMLVVYPVRGEDSLLLEQGVGLGAVALFNVAAALSAYRTASPWWASMRAWLTAGEVDQEAGRGRAELQRGREAGAGVHALIVPRTRPYRTGRLCDGSRGDVPDG